MQRVEAQRAATRAVGEDGFVRRLLPGQDPYDALVYSGQAVPLSDAEVEQEAQLTVATFRRFAETYPNSPLSLAVRTKAVLARVHEFLAGTELQPWQKILAQR